MKKNKNRIPLNKKVLTFFMIAFPTVLIVALSYLSKDAWWGQIFLAIYQFIILQQFVENYYEVLE
jgi:hypothetical protein